MMKKPLFGIEQLPQYLVYAGLAIAALGLAATAYFSDNLVFSRLIGTVNPFKVMIPIVLSGFMLSTVLSRNGSAIYGKETLKGVLISAGLASILGLVAILLDYRIVYPKTMNVLFPESLAYYPSVAFFAEIVFHLLPLGLLSLFLRGKLLWIAVLIAALTDPIFQIFAAVAANYPSWVVLVTGLHVFVINFLMLVVYKRYDFVSMLSFRLVYYIIWHIVWGYFRLRVLF
jgi:hypothetical protein